MCTAHKSESLLIWTTLAPHACLFAQAVAGSGQPTPGLVVTRSPIPGLSQGARWLSQVPEFPLGRHAPLSDRDGVLGTRLCRTPDSWLPAHAHRRLLPRCR